MLCLHVILILSNCVFDFSYFIICFNDIENIINHFFLLIKTEHWFGTHTHIPQILCESFPSALLPPLSLPCPFRYMQRPPGPFVPASREDAPALKAPVKLIGIKIDWVNFRHIPLVELGSFLPLTSIMKPPLKSALLSSSTAKPSAQVRLQLVAKGLGAKDFSVQQQIQQQE